MLYESHPLAFVVEQAGGRATTGKDRVLDLAPKRLHERIPIAIGSAFEVDLYERFVRGGAEAVQSG
jgi:fructose-1,6-bisphosphatase I